MKKMFRKNVWKKIIMILLCMGATLIGACSADSQQEDANGGGIETANTENKRQILMTIWGQQFVFDTAVPEYDISCYRLTTEFPIDFVFDMPEGYCAIIEGNDVETSTYQYQISNIEATNSVINIEFKGAENNIMVRLRTLPADYPEISTYGSGAKPGKYYFTVQGYLTKMDERGNIVFYQKELLKGGECTDVIDFKQVITESGQKYYIYGKRSFDVNLATYQAYEWVIMDERYNVLDTVKYMAESENVDKRIMHDNHDFLLIEYGHYIEAAYVNKRVYNIPKSVGEYPYGSNIQAVVIQEVKNGEVIWTWDSTDYPELYEMCIDDLTADSDLFANFSDTWSDYGHLNSIVIDPKDGNLVCSFRHFNAVIEINRVTGEIEWVLGGNKDEFGLTEEQKFSHQHGANFSFDGALMIFDNANKKGYSRAIEMVIDEESKTVVSYAEYAPELQKSLWMGSAYKVSEDPEVVLIGWGGRGGAERNTLLFSELNVETNEVVFEASCNVDNYRVYRFDD